MYIIQYYVAVLMNEYNVSVLNTKTNAILHHHLALYHSSTPDWFGKFSFYLALVPTTLDLKITNT